MNMLSFQTFPAEVLFKIARNVGGDYLRARVDRVLLCKSWYSVTQSVVWDDVDLSIKCFERYFQAPTSTQSFIQSRVKSLSISDVYDNNSTTLPQLAEKGIISLESYLLAKQRTLLLSRNITLGNAVAAFSTSLRQMHKLQTFTLRLSSGSTIYIEPDNQTWIDTIRCLITSLPKTLTSLTIDKLSQTSAFIAGLKNPHGVCNVVLAKDSLPSLKHLRLRIHSICPSLFSPETIDSHSHLETLVIALETYSPQLVAVHHAHQCTPPHRSGRDLFVDMVEAAKKAVEAKCFPDLKTLRILGFDLQAMAFVSCDVVIGNEVNVPEGVDWDDVDWEGRGRVENDLELTNSDTNGLLES
ncbi:hypothetical protein ONS95_009549 [Cadophora gregata]|uniref:uncharacterized protein n=1 Tax=Cadophora gregata TaxID=51156 RepID=UPI0026DB5E9F|nr:uncharacterized protein ONS95_009549 [Cadophora gregata]KAK0124600.1 hypothetical protein ONS95_009549 [Cadophora gregata]KAK0129543.1 hypothetical protein ONS96_000108 [Cadophora gregata f. sp. sojae]